MRHEETVKSHHPSVYTFTHVDNILDDYTLQAAAKKTGTWAKQSSQVIQLRCVRTTFSEIYCYTLR